MARIEPLHELDDAQRAQLAGGLMVDGRPANLFATLVRHPELCRRVNALGGTLLHGRLPARDRELAILRVAWRTGSAYEHGHHVLMGREAGLDEATMAAVATPERLDARDAELVAAVDVILDVPTVDEATWARLAARYGQDQLLELLALVGFYRMLAGLLASVQVPLDPGLPGWFTDPAA